MDYAFHLPLSPREWQNLSSDEEKYLIQVMPPGDIMTEVIRVLVERQNITSAAILYDETFGQEGYSSILYISHPPPTEMDHRYTSLLLNLPCRHNIIRVMSNDTAGIRQTLTNIKKNAVSTFFIVGTTDTIVTVMSEAQASGLGLFGREYAWYGLSKKGTLECTTTCSTIQNMTIIHMTPTPLTTALLAESNNKQNLYGVTQYPPVDTAFYIDVIWKALLAAQALFAAGGYSAAWAITTCAAFEEANPPLPRTGMDLRAAFEAATITPTYGPLSLSGGNGNSYMEFNLDMTKLSIIKGKITESKRIGNYTTGLPGTVSSVDEDELSSFKAITVYKVVTVVAPPFIINATNASDPNAPEKFEGYCIDLINEIKVLMNFEYTIYPVEDGKFGALSETNKSWNGMIKDLIIGKADIALGPLSVMAERENVVDFTVPYYDLVGITILMKKTKQETALFKFLTVLELDVWLCILAAYFFTSLLLWVFDRFSPYSYQNNREKYIDDDERREFNLKECLWFCMTSLTPQASLSAPTIPGIFQRGVAFENGFHLLPKTLPKFDDGGGEAPKNLSGRLVAATWWLFGFIIIASYTANLAAFLTVSRLDTPIESLDDLSKQYKVRYAPMDGTATMTYFQRMAGIEEKFYQIWKEMSLNDSMDPVERAKLAVWDYPVSDKYTKIWQSMQETGLPNSFEKALDQVRASPSSTEGFAYIAKSRLAVVTIRMADAGDMASKQIPMQKEGSNGDATDIRYQELTNCDLQMVGDEFSRKPYALAVQEGSPLKEQLNDAILKLLNQRRLESLKEKWWNQNPNKKVCDDTDDQSDGISIYNIGGVFIVIFVGIVLACLTLAIEYWYYKLRFRGPSRDSSTDSSTRITNVRGFDERGKEFQTDYGPGRRSAQAW
ncbi:unnamed protein product [Cyprideis torosa]|uniref:Uncharacterized protein n=1 Tax=Cyprideis torosa TaxID=163714 RepID=A0A7R8ZHV9_9CRUS|nr:unnamed protein product [Cyprideis torosa]CAG0883411.1 unnamed protein product [Cyprideis torosa]